MSEEEKDPLAVPLDPPQPVPILVPRCPFCGVQPCQINFGTTGWNLGPGMVAMAAIYCCANCQCILSISALQQPPQAQQRGRRIVMPN
jgi:hypothetical protein